MVEIVSESMMFPPSVPTRKVSSRIARDMNPIYREAVLNLDEDSSLVVIDLMNSTLTHISMISENELVMYFRIISNMTSCSKTDLDMTTTMRNLNMKIPDEISRSHFM